MDDTAAVVHHAMCTAASQDTSLTYSFAPAAIIAIHASLVHQAIVLFAIDNGHYMCTNVCAQKSCTHKDSQTLEHTCTEMKYRACCIEDEQHFVQS